MDKTNTKMKENARSSRYNRLAAYMNGMAQLRGESTVKQARSEKQEGHSNDV